MARDVLIGYAMIDVMAEPSLPGREKHIISLRLCSLLVIGAAIYRIDEECAERFNTGFAGNHFDILHRGEHAQRIINSVWHDHD